MKSLTCSHRAPAGQSQQTFLFQDETSSDKNAGAHGQREPDVEVHAVHVHLENKALLHRIK